MKKTAVLAAVLMACTSVFVFSGCKKAVQLQERNFVMSLGVDMTEQGQWQVSYTFPDLGALTGTGEGTAQPPMVLTGSSLEETGEKLNSMSDKQTDVSQTAVIIIGKAVLEDGGACDQLLSMLSELKGLKRSVLICVSDGKASDISALDEKVSGSVGVYIYDMLMNNFTAENKNNAILQDMLTNEYNSEKEVMLAWLCVAEDKPQVEYFSVLR